MLMNIQNVKNDLELIYEKIDKGIETRSKCQWYEKGEKSTKFFLNLENKKIRESVCNKIRSNLKRDL